MTNPPLRAKDVVVVIERHPAILRELTDHAEGRRVMNSTNYVFSYSGGYVRAQQLAEFLYSPAGGGGTRYLPQVYLPGLLPDWNIELNSAATPDSTGA
jgi:hypothetical protein